MERHQNHHVKQRCIESHLLCSTCSDEVLSGFIAVHWRFSTFLEGGRSAFVFGLLEAMFNPVELRTGPSVFSFLTETSCSKAVFRISAASLGFACPLRLVFMASTRSHELLRHLIGRHPLFLHVFQGGDPVPCDGALPDDPSSECRRA